MSLTKKVLHKHHIEECGGGSKKLSDFENDLFYRKKTPFLTLTKDDFEAWENLDGEMEYLYISSPKLDWLTTTDDIYWELNTSMNGERFAMTSNGIETVVEKETYGKDSAIFYFGDMPLSIESGFDYKNWYEFVPKDEFCIRLDLGVDPATLDEFNLSIYSIVSKKIGGEYIDDMYYTEPDTDVENTILETQTLEFIDMSSEWVYNIGDKTVYGHTITDFVLANHPPIANCDAAQNSLDNNMEFIVYWDGQPYKCICDAGNGLEMFVLGNASILKDDQYRTGEPFCIIANAFYEEDGLYIAAADNSTSHSVGIYYTEHIDGAVHKIPEQYISEHSHNAGDIHGGVLDVSCGGTGASNSVDAIHKLGFAYGYVRSDEITQSPLPVTIDGGHFELTSGGLISFYVPADISFAYTNTANRKRLKVGIYIATIFSPNGSEFKGTLTQGYHLISYIENTGYMLWY